MIIAHAFICENFKVILAVDIEGFVLNIKATIAKCTMRVKAQQTLTQRVTQTETVNLLVLLRK